MKMKLVTVHKGKEVDVLLHAPSRNESWQLAIETPDGIEVVEFAKVKKGKPAIPSVEVTQKALIDAGFDWAIGAISYDETRGYIQIDTTDNYSPIWGSIFSTSPKMKKRTWTVCGRRIEHDEYTALLGAFLKVSKWQGLVSAYIKIVDKGMPLRRLLEMMEGKIVTAKSLKESRASGDSRPPFLPGDRVKWSGGEGILEALNAKAKIRKADGTYSNVAWMGLKVIPDETPTMPDDIHESLAANFDFVLQHPNRIYRVKTKRGRWVCPVFPQKNENQWRDEDALQCDCPICGWGMAESKGYWDDGIFICCMCKQRALVIDKTEKGDELSLLMLRRPDKNRFCMKEARCCTNCGLFQFETGRQGRRTTGYCRVTNMCVQGFNTCSWWFPRNPKRYKANMVQHIKNLHFGIKDDRNTSRHDIRDTIYRKDDHEAQKKRADDAVDAYRRAYRWCMLKLKEMADASPLRIKATNDVKEFYGEELDRE